VSFNVARLAEEISQFDESDWRAHPQRFAGNSSLVLVSTHGEENDTFSAPMQASPRLARTPYIRQVMASFATVVGRSRLMQLAPGASVDQHTDTHYFWRDHLRIHIPILTTPDVSFHCGEEQVHMAAGEAWTFDNWRQHRVHNASDKARVHLVIDTVGSAALWKMLDQSPAAPRRIEFDPDSEPQLKFESFRGLPIMPAAELQNDLEQLVADIAEETDETIRHKQALGAATKDLVHEWRSLWIECGPLPDAYPEFKKLIDAYRGLIDDLPGPLVLSSNRGSFNAAVRYTLDAVLAPERFADSAGAAADRQPVVYRARFDRPVFIVAAPRSGSTLLFETLARNRDLWTVGDESHKQFESIPSLRPTKDNQSNRLTAEFATAEVIDTLLKNLSADLQDSDGQPIVGLPYGSRPETLRFLEKTPKNALRIPFLLEVFPDARFIFLYREARQNISSLLDSWRSRRYVTYPRLPGWPAEQPWSHLLVPGWQQFIKRPLPEVVTYQWVVTNQVIMNDLALLPRDRWCKIEYDAFLDDTPAELERLCRFAEITFGPRMHEVAAKPLKPSKYTLTAPQPDKWKKNARELEPVLSVTEDVMARLRAL
jgi:hypothetical protein